MRSVVRTMIEIAQAQYVMGTVAEIIACVEGDEEQARAAVQEAMREFERLERMFNRFDKESELSQVNERAAAQAVRVSEEFFDMISEGLAYSAISEDSFSVTLAPLSDLWSECASANRLPGEESLRAARKLSDFRLVELDEAARTIRFQHYGMGFDLGGLVKGYAVDRAGKILRESEITGAMISAGTSSLAVFGLNQAGETGETGERWKIGIRHPGDERKIVGTISLNDLSISTSGTYEKRMQIEGRDYSHLLDPRTGYPVEGFMSATAVCRSALKAEVASKLLIFLGCEKALEICDGEQWDVEGVTVTVNELDNNLYVKHTAGLRIEI